MGLRLQIAGEILDGSAEDGNKVIHVANHLGPSDQPMAAILESGDIDAEENASTIAFVTDDEWVQLIAGLRINEAPLSLGAKPKARKLLEACRMTLPAPPDETGQEPTGEQGAPGAATEGEAVAAPTLVGPPRARPVEPQQVQEAVTAQA